MLKPKIRAGGNLCCEGGGRRVVTRGKVMAMTVERVVWIEAGQGSLGDVRRS